MENLKIALQRGVNVGSIQTFTTANVPWNLSRNPWRKVRDLHYNLNIKIQQFKPQKLNNLGDQKFNWNPCKKKSMTRSSRALPFSFSLLWILIYEK